MSYPHLQPDCDILNNGRCSCLNYPVKQRASDGRWFITMGHAGFNTKANNGKGYASQYEAAKDYIKHK